MFVELNDFSWMIINFWVPENFGEQKGFCMEEERSFGTKKCMSWMPF